MIFYEQRNSRKALSSLLSTDRSFIDVDTDIWLDVFLVFSTFDRTKYIITNDPSLRSLRRRI